MIDFDNTHYGPACMALLKGVQPANLGPGDPNHDLQSQLAELDTATLFAGQTIVDQQMANCCRSGLWLLHDFLDESHCISQEIHTPTGSYWHGIMHRREPDYSNSKYWFRKVGQHDVFSPLYAWVQETAESQGTDPVTAQLLEPGRWEPDVFVDVCEAIATGRLSNRSLAESIAFTEWQLLFDYCHRAAIG